MAELLRITRPQLEGFIGNDYEAIIQMELLFDCVNDLATTTAPSAESIFQAGHGLSFQDVVYNNGGTWTLADSSSINSIGYAIVSEVENVNEFTLVYLGQIKNLTGVTAGNWYYVSDTNPGELSLSPGTTYINPILFSLTDTTGLVLPFRADAVTESYGQTSRSEYDSINSAYLYTGRATRGSASSASVWKISRFDFGDGSITYADGDELYDNIWDNRESLSYS